MKPAPIQALLQRAQAESDAMAFTFQDQIWTYAGSTVRELPAKLATRLAAYKIPERFLTVEHLPRNPLGKVDRTALKAMAVGYAQVEEELSHRVSLSVASGH